MHQRGWRKRRSNRGGTEQRTETDSTRDRSLGLVLKDTPQTAVQRCAVAPNGIDSWRRAYDYVKTDSGIRNYGRSYTPVADRPILSHLPNVRIALSTERSVSHFLQKQNLTCVLPMPGLA